MFVSYKWLNDYVDLSSVTPEQLAELITKSGIEVEGIQQLSKNISNVVVGHVLNCEPHPNSDHLNKCLVDLGEGEPVQIICGAKNVAKGQKVAVAKIGARLPGGIKIKRTKLRGEESNGMICSLQELGIEGKLVPKEFAEGIYVFPEDTPVGSDVIQLLNLDDSVLELSLTPNRADALSMLGVAYETAAILKKDVQLPEIQKQTSSEKASDYISVRVDAKEDNPLYVAKVIKNVKIGPSPLWLQTRLMAAGIRPHNNVVDITNYILLEYGQPLHAFDYNRLGSKEILVRRAKQGEKIVTLDDVERTLTENHLVITNGSEPVALAGVMGGANSEVRDDTTMILLESAYFTSPVIRQASKDHGLRSEASNRYEKGIDPSRVREAAERAAELMAKYAGGEVLDGFVEADHLQMEPVTVQITLNKINRVLGTNLSLNEVKEILQRLKLEVDMNNETFIINIPSRRNDLRIEEDIIEEVARLFGYDNLPTTLPEGKTEIGGLTPYQEKRRITRRFLEGAGLSQTVTYSLTNEKQCQKLALKNAEPIKLAMPMSEDRSVLRLSLVPQLLEVLSYNKARKNENLAIYEIGSVFLKNDQQPLPKEEEHLAGALMGLWVNHPWQAEKVKVDFYTVKGILEGLFEKLNVLNDIRFEKANIEHLHPGRTAKIFMNDEEIGYIGQIHPTEAKSYDLDEVYAFELVLEKLLNRESKPLKYIPIPKYPSISRDIALVVDRKTEAKELENIIFEAGKKLLTSVKVFDVYEGEHVEKGKKSIAFSLTYMDPNRTLTDEEVTAVHEKVLNALKEKANATLRG